MAVNEGVQRVFTVTVASAATSSSEVDLGAYFSRVLIGVGSNTWTTKLQVAENTGGTYKNLYTDASTEFAIATGVSGAYVPVENAGRFVKIETTSAAANGASYFIVGVE
jgi:hypothetical protein